MYLKIHTEHGSYSTLELFDLKVFFSIINDIQLFKICDKTYSSF